VISPGSGVSLGIASAYGIKLPGAARSLSLGAGGRETVSAVQMTSSVFPLAPAYLTKKARVFGAVACTLAISHRRSVWGFLSPV